VLLVNSDDMEDEIRVRIILDQKSRQAYHTDRKIILDYLEKGDIALEQYANLLSESVELERLGIAVTDILYRNFQGRLIGSYKENLLKPKNGISEQDFVLIARRRIPPGEELAEMPEGYKLDQVSKLDDVIVKTFKDGKNFRDLIVEFHQRKDTVGKDDDFDFVKEVGKIKKMFDK